MKKKSVLICVNLCQKNINVYLCLLLLVFLSGCGDKIIKTPLQVCPGKANVTESLAALQSQSENMIPLFSNKGKFSYECFYQGKLQKQHFSLRLFVIKPPSEIYLQAKTGIIDKALVLGSNAQEFWLDSDPMGSYMWGKWSDQEEDAGLMINPKTMLEALGIAEIDFDANWSLTNEGPYDILTKTERGVINKKIFIYSCEYRVKKIEYYDSYGEPVVLATLDKYKEVSPGFFIPFSIKINSLTDNIEETVNIDIKLDSIKPATEKQIKYKIAPPAKTPSRDHIYQIIDGETIEL